MGKDKILLEEVARPQGIMPLYLVEALPRHPNQVVSDAGTQVEGFLTQEGMDDNQRGRAFSAVLDALGKVALWHPDIKVEVEWIDENGLPQPMLVSPTEAIRLTASKNIQEINSKPLKR